MLKISAKWSHWSCHQQSPSERDVIHPLFWKSPFANHKENSPPNSKLICCFHTAARTMLSKAKATESNTDQHVPPKQGVQAIGLRENISKLIDGDVQVNYPPLSSTADLSSTPKYRRISFDPTTKVTSNGTTISSANSCLLGPTTSTLKGRPTGAAHSNSGESPKQSVILLSDSICKHIAHVWDLDLLAYPGTNIEDFMTRIRLNKIPELKNATAVILHVGTNNLMNENEDEKLIAQNIFLLARTVYGKYGCFVVISLLIPRPDSDKMNQKAMKVNELIKAGINPSFMHCIYTYRVFIKKSKIDQDLYCKLDKIHPNLQGNKLLFKYLTTRVNEIRKTLKEPKGQCPPPPKQVIRRGNKRW